MPAAALATIATFEVVFFGKDAVTFGRKVIIFTFHWLIFPKLVIHKPQIYKLIFNVFGRFKTFGA